MSARFTVEQASWAAGARVISKGGPFEGVFTDTRAPVPRGLFVALKGDNFDGSDFVQAAVQAGASGALISVDALLEQGNEKFGPADEATRLALKAIDDRGRLKRMSVRLVHVSTWAELLATP